MQRNDMPLSKEAKRGEREGGGERKEELMVLVRDREREKKRTCQVRETRSSLPLKKGIIRSEFEIFIIAWRRQPTLSSCNI